MNGMILIVEGKNDYSKIKQIFPEMNGKCSLFTKGML